MSVERHGVTTEHDEFHEQVTKIVEELDHARVRKTKRTLALALETSRRSE